MTQLLLPAPFGLGQGHHISLRSDHEHFDKRATAKAIAGAGCPAWIIPKIISCLTYSGRYDCLLQANWFNDYRDELELELTLAGVQLIVMHEHPNAEPRPSPYRILRRPDYRQEVFDPLGLGRGLRPVRETSYEGYRRLVLDDEMRDHQRQALMYSLYSTYTMQVSKSLYAVINPEVQG